MANLQQQIAEKFLAALAESKEVDAEKTFSVGLLYGPSGCGKSSLVRAGLLPRLSPELVAVCVDASPGDTNRRILQALRKRLPGLPACGIAGIDAENAVVVGIGDQKIRRV